MSFPHDGGPNRRHSSFRAHVLGDRGSRSTSDSRGSIYIPESREEEIALAGEIDDATDGITTLFQTKFCPQDMRQLALVAHNHMKPAMKDFISTYSEILQKFRITGTQTTMRMCKALWGEANPNIEYGLTCTSGPLGGDAQIAALMCMQDLGALIFFVDPLSAHPHQADIDSLNRLSNCGNIIVCSNPTSAMTMMHALKSALEKGDRGMIPSFFYTLESPAVEEYKQQQEVALRSAIASVKPNAEPPALGLGRYDSVAVMAHDMNTDLELTNESEESDTDSDYDEDEAIEAIQLLPFSMHSGTKPKEPRRPSQALMGMKIPPKKVKKSVRKMLIKTIKQRVRRLDTAGILRKNSSIDPN